MTASRRRNKLFRDKIDSGETLHPVGNVNILLLRCLMFEHLMFATNVCMPQLGLPERYKLSAAG